MKSFYIYVYFDARKPGKFVYGDFCFDYEPFYVGKGRGKRIFELSRNRRSELFVRKVKKIGKPIVKKIIEVTVEKDAFDFEKKLIAVIGRMDLCKGPLINFTDGGPLYESRGSQLPWNKGKKTPLAIREKLSKAHKGQIPWIKGKKHTDETKKKMSDAWEGRVVSDETKQKISGALKGRRRRGITRKKISETLKGRIHTESTRKKISEALKGNVPWNKGLNKKQMEMRA